MAAFNAILTGPVTNPARSLLLNNITSMPKSILRIISIIVSEAITMIIAGKIRDKDLE